MVNKHYKKDIEGLWMYEESGELHIKSQEFYIQYISDEIGRSLSIANNQTGDMYQIPFNDLYKVIAKEVKKNDRSNKKQPRKQE